MTLIAILALPASSDDRMVINRVAELVKRQTGRDVALFSADPARRAAPEANAVDAKFLSDQATAYQSRMAAAGVSVSWPDAVNAVHSGKAGLAA